MRLHRGKRGEGHDVVALVGVEPADGENRPEDRGEHDEDNRDLDPVELEEHLESVGEAPNAFHGSRDYITSREWCQRAGKIENYLNFDKVLRIKFSDMGNGDVSIF